MNKSIRERRSGRRGSITREVELSEERNHR